MYCTFINVHFNAIIKKNIKNKLKGNFQSSSLIVIWLILSILLLWLSQNEQKNKFHEIKDMENIYFTFRLTSSFGFTLKLAQKYDYTIKICFNKPYTTKIFYLLFIIWHKNSYTVKPVFNSHPWDPKKAAVVQRLRHRWPLFTVYYYKNFENWGSSWPL